MAKIFSITNSPTKPNKLAVVKGVVPQNPDNSNPFFGAKGTVNNVERFMEFWALMDAVQKHGYIRAAIGVIGRSSVGSWWSLVKHTEYGDLGTEIERRLLYDFYIHRYRSWTSVLDYQNIATKLMMGIMYLRYFGQAAYHILRDASGRPVGMDFLHGLVLPNFDSTGTFVQPAFVQFPSRNPRDRIEFPNQRDIIYMVNPDWEGDPSGGTDMESLATFTLPLDIYLMTGAREYLRNRDKPEVVYELSPDLSDEAFDDFVAEMGSRHAGPLNMGRNPIAVQGDFKVHELRPLPKELPYQQSRKDSRDEELAVIGVNGAKLGIVEEQTGTAFRELRKEFHETGLSPLQVIFELFLYEQLHVREFNAPGWIFKFNSPDFLTAVERATVHMRYRQMGVLSPNEIRHELGRRPRLDEGGDQYSVPVGQDVEGGMDNGTGQPGSTPEGRPIEPDDPSQIGAPSDNDADPVRGDGHDEETRSLMASELRAWKRFVLRRLERNKTMRSFETRYIPKDIADAIQRVIDGASQPDEVAAVFREVINIIENAEVSTNG